ncbi:MAG: NAD(+)/NADH kinase [Coriobacteriaceae bacterium]
MHILVVRNNSNPQAVDASLLLTAYLTSQGIEALLVDSSSLGTDAGRREVRAQLPGQLALVVVLGGDGTVLHTVHLLHDRQVPILPINFGRLGFLANADTDGVVPLVAEALAGDLRRAPQHSLHRGGLRSEHDPRGGKAGMSRPDVNAKPSAATPPSVRKPGETEGAPWTPVPGRFGVNGRGLSGARQFFALNEAAITRGAMGRIIELTLNVSGVDVARMRGDGLVVSTATGSTAYALSAGGPLVSPGFKGMIAVPLAPHTLRSRAVVTDASDVIEVGFDDTDEFREATLFVDGDIVPFDAPLRKIYVQCAPFDVTLLRADGASFYDRISKDFFGE